MQAMVSKGIVHRDLKPQNILLAHDGRTKNPQPQDITLKIGKITLPLMMRLSIPVIRHTYVSLVVGCAPYF